MIASVLGAGVIAIDISDEKLDFARSVGALRTVNANDQENVVEAVRDLSHGGVDLSIDALGSPTTCYNSIACLKKRGKHIQVGLMLGEHVNSSVPMDQIIAKELEILGSHGIQAYVYPDILRMVDQGKLDPRKLIGPRIGLEEAPKALMDMDRFNSVGITVVDRF